MAGLNDREKLMIAETHLDLLRSKLDEWHMSWTVLHEKLSKVSRSNIEGQAFVRGSVSALNIGLNRINELYAILGDEKDE